jgi:hypothetical protein
MPGDLTASRGEAAFSRTRYSLGVVFISASLCTLPSEFFMNRWSLDTE